MAENQDTSRVFVTGAPGSRRFDKISEFVDRRFAAESRIASFAIEAEIGGTSYSESLGTFDKERWPDSQQSLRPQYASALGRYVIRHQDGTEWSNDELQQFVKDNPQYHPATLYGKPNPRAGELITSANITDVDDPFMISPIWAILLEEGEGEFVGSSVDKFRIDALRGHREAMTETVDGIRSGEVNFVIRQPEIGEKRAEEKRERKELAFENYQGLKTDHEKMLNMLRIFGMDFDETVTSATLRNELWKRVDEDSTVAGGTSSLDLFLKYSEMASKQPAEFTLRAILALAGTRKLIFERAGVYEFQGSPLGTTFDEVLTRMRSPENGSVLDAIKMKLGWT